MKAGQELTFYSIATAAIAKVATVGEAKTLVDKAAAIRVFAAKQNWSAEQRTKIAEIETRATVRLGELLKDEGERRGNQKFRKGTIATNASLGVTKKQSHVAQQAASVPVASREKYIAESAAKGKLSVTGLVRLANERKRESKRAKDRQKVAAAPDPSSLQGAFSAIVIDPPWDFGDEGDADQFGRGRPDYATLTIDRIAALPVADRAAKDAHLYLWITNRSLPKGFALLDAWGFRYVTCLTWCKPSIGLGNYFRGSTEQVLFGVRGSLPLSRKDVGTWFAAPRPGRGHSGKPAEFYALVESCSPGPYLEMFSRSGRNGWTHWGSGT